MQNNDISGPVRQAVADLCDKHEIQIQAQERVKQIESDLLKACHELNVASGRTANAKVQLKEILKFDNYGKLEEQCILHMQYAVVVRHEETVIVTKITGRKP